MNTLITKIPVVFFTNKKTFQSDERIDLIENTLNNILPHGSGIDCKWEFVFHKNGKVTCKNYFHAMNEHGYYDGYMPFKFTLFINENEQVSFSNVICNDNRKASFYGLKDYLNETIDYYINEYNQNIACHS